MVLVLEQFLRNLRESRLLPAEEIASLQKAVQGSKTPHSAEDVAKLLIQGGKLTEYQAVTIGQGRQQGLVLGEYVLLDILGKGGMGIVFRARHRLMDRVVALKTLPSALKPDSVQRFYREVKAAARLSHPNIVTAYDAGEHAGTHYLVMEYVVGRDLSAMVKEKGPLPLRQAIDYGQQTARGLEYAHKHGVVHRDVKPSNLLLDQEGVIKILDMGLARLNEEMAGPAEQAELTGTGQILGTVDYMAPEQAEDVRSANHLSDIYSLGCTLFFLLTRRAAYGGETLLKRILAHRDEPIPSVAELRPDCPPTLDAAIRRMLAKRPEERPQSMAEIINELECCLAKPAAAPPVAVPPAVRATSAENWLDDLGHQDETPRTEDSQIGEGTLGPRSKLDLPSPPPPPRSGAAGSSARRPAPQGNRRAKPSTSASARRIARSSRKAWKVALVLLAVAVLAAAAAALFLTAGNVRPPAGKPRTGGDASGNGQKPPNPVPLPKPSSTRQSFPMTPLWFCKSSGMTPPGTAPPFAESPFVWVALPEQLPQPLLSAAPLGAPLLTSPPT